MRRYSPCDVWLALGGLIALPFDFHFGFTGPKQPYQIIGLAVLLLKQTDDLHALCSCIGKTGGAAPGVCRLRRR